MMSELGRETVSAYAAAKGGLKMLTRNIASEYGDTTSSVMVLARVTSLLRRLHRFANRKLTVHVIRSMHLSLLRLRLHVGVLLKI